MSKIEWKTNKDKFEAIGYLSKPGVVDCIEASVPADLLNKFKEQFDGKYTSEFPYVMKAKSKYGFQFRIYLQDTEGCPKFLQQYLDDKYDNRINDTAFIRELVSEYGFKLTHEPQDTAEIKRLVYEKCRLDKSLKGCKAAFDKGFSVYENFIASLEKKTAGKTIPKPVLAKESVKKKKTGRRTTKNTSSGERKTAFTDEQLYMMGLIGEEYVARLLIAKNKDVIKALNIDGDYTVEWFNDGFRTTADWKDQSVGKGCDILVTDKKRKIYIEVKSSKRKPLIFTMTSKEMQTMEKRLDAYFVVKVDYLEKLAKGNSPELTIINNPFESYFKPVKMKSATFMIGE